MSKTQTKSMSNQDGTGKELLKIYHEHDTSRKCKGIILQICGKLTVYQYDVEW
jgi:hypothetical protein